MGIKRLEKAPDHKNIFDTLINDAVGRNKNLWQFACFCSAQESSCSIALDGGWGTGKTFFLNQLKMVFDTYGDQSEQLNADEQKQLQLLFNSYAAEDQLGMTIKHHVCVYYDAWLNDNADDPLHSILYELIKQTKNKFVKNGKADYWKAACATFDAFTGRNTSSLVDLAIETNPVCDIEKQKSFHKSFADYLDNLIPEGYGRLLVLIDELDRCKPSYAVQLLERIKHYLSNKRITFVFSVNEGQLQSAIKAFYGDGVKACEYLDRFFDYRLSLPPPDIERFFNYYSLFHIDKESAIYLAVCEAVIKEYSFSLREIIKYMQWVTIVCKSFAVQGNDSEQLGWQFVMHIIIPFVLGLRLRNTNLLNSFLAGKQKDNNPLRTIIEHCEIAQYFLYLPKRPFVFPQDATFDRNKMVSALSNLDNLYSIIFINKLNGNDSQSMLSFTITKKMIDTIYEASNFMADFIKYDTNTEETAHE